MQEQHLKQQQQQEEEQEEDWEGAGEDAVALHTSSSGSRSSSSNIIIDTPVAATSSSPRSAHDISTTAANPGPRITRPAAESAAEPSGTTMPAMLTRLIDPGPDKALLPSMPKVPLNTMLTGAAARESAGVVQQRGERKRGHAASSGASNVLLMPPLTMPGLTVQDGTRSSTMR